MTTHVTTHPCETCAIRPEEHDLLRAALRDWYDKQAFTDEHVAQVAFQRWLVEVLSHKRPDGPCA